MKTRSFVTLGAACLLGRRRYERAEHCQRLLPASKQLCEPQRIQRIGNPEYKRETCYA